jgi:Ca2+-binding RTX toxin-like protein
MTRRVVTLTVTSILLGTVFASSPAVAAKRCFGRMATIVGTNQDPGAPVDLHGTPGDDVIVGLKGWDLIDGLGGDDLICSGGGDDYVKAGKGNDKVKGAGGLDSLHGDRGNDVLFGGKGPVDSILGGAGNDQLFGGLGSEDSLIGGPGDDAMDGGPGYDLAEFWDSPTGVEADLETGVASGHGNDTIVSIEGLVGSRFDDVLNGDERSNMLQGAEGDDEIHARGSSIDGSFDIIRSGVGEDLLDGGAGPDRVSYNLSPFTVEVDLTVGEAISGGGYGHDTLVSIEDVVGSKYDDTLIGDDGVNELFGNNGADILVGSGGDDVLDGEAGNDEANGGEGFDSCEAEIQAECETGPP